MNLNGTKEMLAIDEEVMTNERLVNNPITASAFELSDNAKIKLLSSKFEEILQILGLDVTDDSLRETPHRIAKMYINEIFIGLNPKNRPEITLFKNTYKYHTPLTELGIPFTSFCEHHFVPIMGTANISYIPNDYVIGLSKLHRITDYYARRPQVQERLTNQIFDVISNELKTESVGVVLKASHSCISCRGVGDLGSSTITSAFSGEIAANETLKGFLLRS